MTKFDPYQRWLGIPPQDQPPHFYRLLGLELFEADPQVIKAASDNAIAFIQQNAFGEELQQSQKLLQDIGKVTAYLLSPPHKAKYDRKLKSKLGISQPKAVSTEKPTQPTNRKQSPKQTASTALPQESSQAIRQESPSITSSQQRQILQSKFKLMGIEISYLWATVGAVCLMAVTVLLGIQFMGSDSEQQAAVSPQPVAPGKPVSVQPPASPDANNQALAAKADNPVPQNAKQPAQPDPAVAKPKAPMPPPVDEFASLFTVQADSLNKKPGKQLADVTVEVIYQPGPKKSERVLLDTIKTDAKGQGQLKVKLTPQQQTGRFLVKLTRENETWERKLTNFPNELTQTLTIPVAMKPEYLNPAWIEQRLAEVSINDLIEEYRQVNDPVVQTVGSALELSRPILENHPEALHEQLQLRLLTHQEPALAVFQVLPNQKIQFRSEWPTFNQAGGPLIRSLGNSSRSLYCLALTPDGKYAVTGRDDKLIRIWDISTGKLIRTLKGHTRRLTCVAVTPDGKHIVSGSEDKTLKVWEFATGKVLQTLKGHLKSVKCLAVSPDGKQIVSGGYNDNVKQWELASGNLIRSIGSQKRTIESVAISPDGKMILSGSNDGLLVNSSDTGRQIGMFKRTNDQFAFFNIVITPDSQHVVSGGSHPTVWDLSSGKAVRFLEGHGGTIFSLALSSNGKQLIAGSTDHRLYVWDFESANLVQTLKGHTDRIDLVAILPDGNQAISGSYDKSLRLWNLEGNRPAKAPDTHINTVNRVVIASDGKQAISGANNELKVWDLDSGQLLKDIKETRNYNQWISYLPDENYAISGWSSSFLGWDLRSGTKVQETALEKLSYYGPVAATPDGTRGITVAEQNAAKMYPLKVWDLTRHKLLYLLKGHQKRTRLLDVSADGTQLFSASEKEVKVWDLKSGTLLHTYQDPIRDLRCLALSRDGKYALTSDNYNKQRAIQVWDLNNKKRIHTLKGHTQDIKCLAVSPDGTLVVSYAADKTIKLWDLIDGKLLATHVFDDAANTITMGPDNRTLLVGCNSGRIHKIKIQIPGEAKDFQPAPNLLAQSTTKTQTAQKQQSILAKSLNKKVKITNTLEMQFALIPAGKFVMGSEKSAAEIAKQFNTKPSFFSQEHPQHVVEITKPFYMGMHEVTIDEFKQFVKMTGYKTESERSGNGGTGWDEATQKFITRVPEFNWMNTGWLKSDFHPVVNVSWNDAVHFCEWLSQREKLKYRLPTEAEWEYACRAGATGFYHHGNDAEALSEFGNIWDSSAKQQFQKNYAHLKGISTQDGFAFTAPVGSFQANAWSLYDLHGNVMEWCSDRYDENYYKSLEGKTSIDLQGPPSGSDHVVRGGSWTYLPQYARAAYRFKFAPSSYANHIGFRVVLEIE